MDYFDIIALFIGYLILVVLILAIGYSFYNWVIYGEVGENVSTIIRNKKVYINNKLVAENIESNNITTINGDVYVDGIRIYKHKRKTRWSK